MRALTAKVAATERRLMSTIIQHVAGVNVRGSGTKWYKAQTQCSILLPSTQSATTDELRLSCSRSGSVSADWFEIYSFVKNLTDRFVR